MNVRIGLAQHRIGPDMEENLRQAQRAVLACAGQGAQLVLLPEMFCCLYQGLCAAARRRNLEASARAGVSGRCVSSGRQYAGT